MKRHPRAPTETAHKVTHHQVQSSNIKSIGHDHNSDTLHVKFHSGGHYAYHNVPKETFLVMLAAPSKGKFLHKMIKPGHKFTKIT